MLRRFHWTMVVAAYVLSWWLDDSFFTGWLHDVFEFAGLYPDFLRESAQSSVNKNFAKVTVLLLVGLGLLARCIRAPRSMEKIYFALIFWSVMVTGTLFHWVTKRGRGGCSRCGSAGSDAGGTCAGGVVQDGVRRAQV